MTALYEQLPPHDIPAEETVVASLMVDPDAIVKVSPILNKGDFFRESDAWVYDAALALYERNEPINQITVAHELDRRGRLEDVGGLTFLSELILNLPTAVGVEHHAQLVKRDSTYRRMISAAMSILQTAYQAGPDLDAAQAKAEQLIYNLRDEGVQRDFVALRTLLEPYYDLPERPDLKPFGGRVRTGLGDLDMVLGGLSDSDLIIVAARTGVGKTSLMLNIARAAAVNQQAKVAFFSLEMSGEQLAQRLLAAESGVDLMRLRLGTHNEAEESRIMNALGVLQETQVFIDDSHTLDVPSVRAKLRRLQQDHGVDLVIVDYLQLMHGGRSENRVQEVSQITRSLKQLAGEMDVPLIAGSQLSRATEQRAGHLPLLSDLRESGSIEQDADVVLFIHRVEAFMARAEWESLHPDKVKEPYPEGLAQLIVAKHRNGPVGEATVRFYSHLSLFDDLNPVGPGTRALASRTDKA